MAAITMRSPTFHATQRVIFTGKKTREKWKWFWTVPRQLDFVEFLQLMSCLVAHLSAFSVGFQWAPGHEGRMLDDVQAPAAGAHFGVFFAHPRDFDQWIHETKSFSVFFFFKSLSLDAFTSKLLFPWLLHLGSVKIKTEEPGSPRSSVALRETAWKG